MSLNTAVYGIMLLVGGVLADRLGAKWTLVLGFCGAIAVGLMLRLQSPVLLLVIAPVYGLLFSFATIGSRTYLARGPPLSADGDWAGALLLSCASPYPWRWAAQLAAGLPIRQALAHWAWFAIVAGLVLVPLTAWLLPSVEAKRNESEPATEAEEPKASFSDYLALLRNARILSSLRLCASAPRISTAP